MRHMKRDSRKRTQRRGAALVEFALISPIFLMLIVGIIELGRAVIVKQLVTNASREGARIAGYDSTTQTATVTGTVNAYLLNVGISGATTVCSPDPPSLAADGQSVSVSVSIPYSSVTWLPTTFFMGGQKLQATTVMCRQPAP